MCPFSVTVQHVPDRELGPLLTRLAEAGFDNPIISLVGADGASDTAEAPVRGRPLDLPEDWRLLRAREGESYRWPNGRDRYTPYRVFMGTTRTEGAVQIGLGETIRKNKWGRDRKYVVAFLSAGSPQQPLVEFVAADDYEQTTTTAAQAASPPGLTSSPCSRQECVCAAGPGRSGRWCSSRRPGRWWRMQARALSAKPRPAS
jgi:hypothetical protein